MVRFILIPTLFFLLIGCKNNKLKESLISKKSHQDEIIKKDTVLVYKSKSVLKLLDSLTNFKFIQVKDELYVNNLKVIPFYGSNTSQKKFKKYYTEVDEYNNKGIGSFYFSKDLKTTVVNLNLCSRLTDKIKGVINNFEFVSERTYPIDGGGKAVLKYYCNKNNIVILLFNQVISKYSIPKKCDIKNENPNFLERIYITEKNGFKKNLLNSGWNLFNNDEIFQKTISTCN